MTSEQMGAGRTFRCYGFDVVVEPTGGMWKWTVTPPDGKTQWMIEGDDMTPFNYSTGMVPTRKAAMLVASQCAVRYGRMRLEFGSLYLERLGS